MSYLPKPNNLPKEPQRSNILFHSSPINNTYSTLSRLNRDGIYYNVNKTFFLFSFSFFGFIFTDLEDEKERVWD